MSPKLCTLSPFCPQLATDVNVNRFRDAPTAIGCPVEALEVVDDDDGGVEVVDEEVAEDDGGGVEVVDEEVVDDDGGGVEVVDGEEVVGGGGGGGGVLELVGGGGGEIGRAHV